MEAEILTDFPERFRQLRRVLLSSGSFQSWEELEGFWFHKGRVVFKFAGRERPHEVQELVGCEILIPEDQRVVLPENTYYDHDLIGCCLFEADRLLGTVRSLFKVGDTLTNLVVEDARGAEFMVPAVKEFLLAVDVAAKRIDASLPPGLIELGEPSASKETKSGATNLIEIITIFPAMLENVFDFGMVQQARKLGLLEVDIVDLRAFTDDKHRTVDDRPYGGGAGMVLKPEPVFRAVEACKAKGGSAPHVVLLTPQGKRFDQKKAKELSLKARLLLLCGRYEGVDQRVADYLADEEISIGDYVLSGGELAAAVIVEAVSRLIPGVLGEGESVLEESFMEDSLDYPHYTRPADFRGMKVPPVLLSGDHRKIRTWREKEAAARTREKRPDIVADEGGRLKERKDESA